MAVVPTVVPGRPDSGERDDFEAFYPAGIDRVYRAPAVTLRRDDLAQEAADEAMARAYAGWPVLRGLDNPAGWVIRVGLNWATSWWRRLRRERPPVPDEAHPPAGASAAHDAPALLPVPQRAVVTCRVLLDLSTAETAAVLGLSEGAVKSRLSRGSPPCALR